MVTSPTSSDLSWADRPGRALIRLALPITVSTISAATMLLASTAFVAQVGSDELAGVGLGATVGFALVCFGIGLLRGGKTLVSQAVGAGRGDKLPALIGAAIVIALGYGLVALIAGQLIAPLLVGVSASPRAGAFAARYLVIRSCGAPIQMLFAALREVSYGEGRSREPMRASLAGNAVNIAVCLVLILGLGWGVSGAAVALLCGQVTELCLLAWTMRARLRRLGWTPAAARQVWAEGLANGVQFVMEIGAFVILTVLIAAMSAVDGAAHQLVMQLMSVSYLPAHALSEAASVLVGQAVGAGRHALVPVIARRAFAIGVGYASACCVLLATLGGSIAQAMSAGDATLAARSTTLIHIGLAFLIADASNVIARGVLRGASDVRYAAVLGIATSWLTTPPLTWLLGMKLELGAAGGWIALNVEIFIAAALLWHRIRRGGWAPSAAAAAQRALAGTAV